MNDQEHPANSTTRHCAVCLITIESSPKVCAKCRRRTYCSTECQRMDWKLGCLQGHKNWCELGCGEEGIDWEILDYGPTKGLGVRAMRDFKKLERIIVDGIRQESDPVINDLHPLGGSISEKVLLNQLACESPNEYALCARMARVNHSCDPNAFHIYDATFKVKILVSQRDIHAGDEICISYPNWDDPTSSVSPESARVGLMMKWGIICDVNCRCYDSNVLRYLKQASNLDTQIFEKSSKGDIVGAIYAADSLLALHETMHSPPMSMVRVYYDRFQLYIMTKKTLHKATNDINQCYLLKASIYHPQSQEAMEILQLVRDPSKHRNYLFYELRR